MWYDSAMHAVSAVHMESLRRPRALVFMDVPPDQADARVDGSDWSLTDEEDMAHAPEHNAASDMFGSSVRQLFRERGWDEGRVRLDEFFAWVRRQPLVRVSPDVFVLAAAP